MTNEATPPGPSRALPSLDQIPSMWSVVPSLRSGVVRFAGAGVVPMIAFYVAFRIWGPVIGILTGTTVSLTVLGIQAVRLRRLDPIVLVPMLVIVTQGTVAIMAGSVEIYLAAPAAEACIWGSVLVGSVLVRRPLVPIIARELGVVPSQYAHLIPVRRSLELLTLAWGLAAFAKAALRLWLLVVLPLEVFLVAITVSIAAMNVCLLALSVWLPFAMVRRELRARPV